MDLLILSEQIRHSLSGELGGKQRDAEAVLLPCVFPDLHKTRQPAIPSHPTHWGGDRAS